MGKRDVHRGRARAVTMTLATALVATLIVEAAACIDVETTKLCEDAWCNHRGDCEDDGHEARCACDEGFENMDRFLRCVPADGERFTFIEFPLTIGTLSMGSPASEVGRHADERGHDVELSEDYVIQGTEVTLREFDEVMGYVPAGSWLRTDDSDDLDRPIDWVSWHQAAAYCNQLSRESHHELCYECGGASEERSPYVECTFPGHYENPYACGGYRLPTEAEWEYAARGGTQTATYNGDLDARYMGCDSEVLNPIAAYCGNSSETRPVMEGEPTLWGSYGDGGDGRLYDMLGNVAEWCHDWYDSYPATFSALPWGPPDEVDSQGRVYRGGSFDDNAEDLRAARRFHAAPDTQSANIGFRVVRTFRPR